MTEWTTRIPSEMTRRYGVEELHTVCFAHKDWMGKGPTVSLGIPECELTCIVLDASREPVATINRPKTNRNVRSWTRMACKLAAEQQAFLMFQCDTAEQAEIAAHEAARLLPNYHRAALERMYDPATRVVDKLS